jgi:nitrite reductase/ring-hydroxylating ferredoxin subunit
VRARKSAKYILIAAIAVLMVVTAACSSSNAGTQPAQPGQTTEARQTVQPIQTTQPNQGKISPTWIVASVNGATMSISKNAVDSAGMAHFKVPSGTGQQSLTFMAYRINGELQVRANVCVPCRSTSFSLDGDKLVCNTCGSVFKANSGAGISGPCRNYPKASASYQISGDSIVMQMSDLQTSYDDTLIPG